MWTRGGTSGDLCGERAHLGTENVPGPGPYVSACCWPKVQGSAVPKVPRYMVQSTSNSVRTGTHENYVLRYSRPRYVPQPPAQVGTRPWMTTRVRIQVPRYPGALPSKQPWKSTSPTPRIEATKGRETHPPSIFYSVLSFCLDSDEEGCNAHTQTKRVLQTGSHKQSTALCLPCQ